MRKNKNNSVQSLKEREDLLTCLYYRFTEQTAPWMYIKNPEIKKKLPGYLDAFYRKFDVIYGENFKNLLKDPGLADNRSLEEIEDSLEDPETNFALYNFASAARAEPDKALIARIRSSYEYGLLFFQIFDTAHRIISVEEEPRTDELVAEDTILVLAAAAESFPSREGYLWSERKFSKFTSSLYRTREGDYRFILYIPHRQQGKLIVQIRIFHPGQETRILEAICRENESTPVLPFQGEINEHTRITIRLFKYQDRVQRTGGMKIMVPILGLRNQGEPGNFSEIQELVLCGLESLPRNQFDYLSFSLTSELKPLLCIIANIFYHRTGVCVKAHFELSAISDSRILNRQRNLDSLGLGLMTRLCYDYREKMAGSRPRKAEYDILCITGVLLENPTLDQKRHGLFLSETTGKVPAKLKAFLDYLKENKLQNLRCAFIYCGREPEHKLAEIINQSGLPRVTVRKFSDFNALIQHLTGQEPVRYKAVPGPAPKRRLWIPLAAIFFTALLTPLVLFFTGFFNKHAECRDLGQLVRQEKYEQITQYMRNCNTFESYGAEVASAVEWAKENHKPEVLKRLIDGGASVDTSAFQGNQRQQSLLENAIRGRLIKIHKTTQLEEDLAVWGTYTEGLPVWSRKAVTAPALDHHALQYSLEGGGPYAHIHGYLNLGAAVPDGAEIRLSLSFQYHPETAFNNDSAASSVQAIEFSQSVWKNSRRWEMALQWQNVGEGAPQWRYWDPQQGWLSLGLPAIPAAYQWHTLVLTGRLSGETIIYKSFTFNGKSHVLDISVNAFPVKEKTDYISTGFQLDGNYQSDPYSVIVDNVEIQLIAGSR